MRIIGNLLALVGAILFVYTFVVRILGTTTILDFSKIPVLSDYLVGGFTAVGMFSGIACILLPAVIALVKSQE